MREPPSDVDLEVFSYSVALQDRQWTGQETVGPIERTAAAHYALYIARQNAVPLILANQIETQLRTFLNKRAEREESKHFSTALESFLAAPGELQRRANYLADVYERSSHENEQSPDKESPLALSRLFDSAIRAPGDAARLYTHYSSCLADLRELRTEEAFSTGRQSAFRLSPALRHMIRSQRAAFRTVLFEERSIAQQLDRPAFSEDRLRSASLMGKPAFEESFTIQVGNQVKTTCAVKLLCQRLAEFCQPLCSELEYQSVALSLYSTNISAIISFDENLLAEVKWAPELHFPDVESQYESAIELLQQSSGRNILEDGEYVLTRHSGLQQQLVFNVHLTDAEAVFRSSEQGLVAKPLLSILRLCSHSLGVKTLTMPLLLSSKLTSAMTPDWCVQRAEVVFKAIKNHLTLLSWSETVIQFVLPAETPEVVFSLIAHSATNVFKMSEPIVIRPSASTLSFQ